MIFIFLLTWSTFSEVDAWEIAPRFSDLLANTGVQFFQDRVKLLHPMDRLHGLTGSSCGGTIHLESGLTIEYDWYNIYYSLSISKLFPSGCPSVVFDIGKNWSFDLCLFLDWPMTSESNPIENLKTLIGYWNLILICVLLTLCFSSWAARLVLALGAEAKLDLIPGAAEFALPFSTLEDACVSVGLWEEGKFIIWYIVTERFCLYVTININCLSNMVVLWCRGLTIV